MPIIDLTPFCPVQKFQFGGTCFAYAPTYTAYSTQYNIFHQITDRAQIEANAFSEGFVASMVRASLPRWYRNIIDGNCKYRGTAEKSLDVLKQYGCTPISLFDVNCQNGIEQAILDEAAPYRISDYKTITKNFIFSDMAIQQIVAELSQQRPVITAIYQTDEFYDIRTGSAVLTDLNPNHHSANHDVCILGYDNSMFGGSGAFQVKNNYQGWGKEGFCWVRCEDYMNLIDLSYSIQLS